MTTGRGVALVGAMLAGVLLAGCAPAEETVALPEGVTVELIQLRSDVAARTAQVKVHNGTDSDLVVNRVVVNDERFDGPGERDKVTVITAGRTVDLRFSLPPVSCSREDGTPVPTDVEATAMLYYEVGGDPAVSSAALPDPLGFVPRLHDRECLRERVADVVGLEWVGFEPSPPGIPATLSLALTPTGADATATIQGIRTTNLLAFTLQDADTLALGQTVSGMDAASALDVPLVPWRCDPHAVQEDKRGTVFTLDVEVAGSTGPIDVPAPETMRADILTWVAQWCGFAE